MGKDFLLKAIVAICGLVWLGALVLDGTVAASKGLIAPFSVVVSVAGGLTWLFEQMALELASGAAARRAPRPARHMEG